MSSPVSKLPPPTTVTTICDYGSPVFQAALASTTITGSSTIAANGARFYPFTIDQPTPVTQFFTQNGSAATGNIDMGIYNFDGTKIVSTGSTAQAVAFAIQVISITPILLPPGTYYLAIAASSASTTFTVTAAGTAGLEVAMSGHALNTSAFPLPSTVTLTTSTSTTMIFFGFATVPTF